jgi:hypothetical protein
MAFDPNIEYNENLPVKENLKAMMNWLNAVCKEMYVGRVPQNKEDADTKIEAVRGEISPVFAAATFIADGFTDEQAMQVPVLYAEWRPEVKYPAGKRLTYGVNGVGDPQLYLVLQEHTSAAEHMPDKAVSLYKPIGLTEDGIPEWAQPYGESDAYEIGDVVYHNGVKWECTEGDANGKNIWEPGVYGWTEVNE